MELLRQVMVESKINSLLEDASEDALIDVGAHPCQQTAGDPRLLTGTDQREKNEEKNDGIPVVLISCF